MYVCTYMRNLYIIYIITCICKWSSISLLNYRPATTRARWNETLNYFNQLIIMNRVVESYLATIAFILMGSGLVLSSALNFATIRLYDIGLPFVFYLTYPFFAVCVLTIILSLLPVGIRIHERSATTLVKWRQILGARDAQFAKRLRGTRPLIFYAGLNAHNFYSIQKSLMTTYIMAIVDYTINLLVSFPTLHF